MLSCSAVTGGELIGHNAPFSHVVINSMDIMAGDLFIAIKGQRNDGHEFIADAISRGAAGVIGTKKQKISIPYIQIKNINKGLADIAKEWRKNYSMPCIGITGSNGKTTVKEYIGQILSQSYKNHISKGNYNNELGLPLSVIGLREDTQCAVFEMGASHVGDIKYLADIAKPNIGIITNASHVHLSKFGGIDEIVKTKGELVECLPEEGIAILNKDDPNYDYWSSVKGCKNEITFSMNNKADIYPLAIKERQDKGFRLKINCQNNHLIEFDYQAISMQNIQNLLPAIAVGVALNIASEKIINAILTMPSISQRMELKRHKSGYLIIDDTYNANPVSTKNALDTLANIASGKRIFLFGGMEELGDSSMELHSDIGKYAAKKSDIMIVVEGIAEQAFNDYKGKKIKVKDNSAAVKAVELILDKDSTVLIKGSRKAKLELVVSELMTGGLN
jgi:UDP-N-acetylmuramoyl-tripeptide--D-alanyl-D-alanine ligase